MFPGGVNTSDCLLSCRAFTRPLHVVQVIILACVLGSLLVLPLLAWLLRRCYLARRHSKVGGQAAPCSNTLHCLSRMPGGAVCRPDVPQAGRSPTRHPAGPCRRSGRRGSRAIWPARVLQPGLRRRGRGLRLQRGHQHRQAGPRIAAVSVDGASASRSRHGRRQLPPELVAPVRARFGSSLVALPGETLARMAGLQYSVPYFNSDPHRASSPLF